MLSAASRYITHQVVMSAWHRKPILLFAVVGITLLVLFVQYSHVGSESKPLRPVHEPLHKEPEPYQANQYHEYAETEAKKKTTESPATPPKIPLNLPIEPKKIVPNDDNVADHQMQRDQLRPQTPSKIKYPSAPIPEPTSANRGAPLNRIIHFDLKGAPPTLTYIRRVLPMIKKAGATGILLEYEDMFPYTGSLAFARAGNAYDVNELEELLSYITVDLKLEVIPLIQTFGHMEFVLKQQKYRHLREVDEFPAVICPSKNESFAVIKEMARQMMAVHSKFHSRYLHIGCDEVFHIGDCNLCRSKSREELLLGHMAQVGEFVRKELKVIPIVWDDMLRNHMSDQLKRYRLHEIVEPMVWTYVKDIYRFIPISTWMTFGEVFQQVWATSAFKGAFGETLTVPSARDHLNNNKAWLEVIEEHKSKFHPFRGLVISGWQRYDHFATLAETFPAGFPSMMLNLLVATAGGFDGKEKHIRDQLSEALMCQGGLSRFDLETDEYLWNAVGHCAFPGAAVFRMTENHRDVIKRANEYHEGVTVNKAWLTPYNVRRNYTFIDRIDQGLEEFHSVYYGLTSLVAQARDALREVFDEFTVAEWIEQNIYPSILKLEKLREDAESMRRARTWPTGPQQINKDLLRFNVGREEL